MKFADIKGITCGKNIKSLYIDSEVLKYGDQMGFVTPVVHTLTYGNQSFKLTLIKKDYIILIRVFSII